MANITTIAIVGAAVAFVFIALAVFEKCYPRSIIFHFMDKRLWGTPLVFLVLTPILFTVSSSKESDQEGADVYATLSYCSLEVFIILAVFALCRYDKEKPVEPGAGRYWLAGGFGEGYLNA